MDAALTTFAGLAPDGPLHPQLLVTGIVAGLGAAMVAGRSGRRWLLLVVIVAGILATTAQDDVLGASFGDRDDRLVVVGATAAVVVAGSLLRLRWSTAVIAALGATAGVWAVVPDTEVPLIAGAVLVGAAMVRCLPGWLADDRRRLHGLLFLLPAVAAAAGSVGRTARHEPALAVGFLGAMLALSAWRLLWAVTQTRRAGRPDQRAGTPTTVAPGATSSITTAPAPTTAF